MPIVDQFEVPPEMLLSNKDVDKLAKLLDCFTGLEEIGKFFDNQAFDAFIMKLILMLDEIKNDGNILDFITFESRLEFFPCEIVVE